MDTTLAYEPRARRVALAARGGEMALLDFGPADRPVDIVFSHANGFNGRTYRSILAPLAEDLRILAVDMRGHGASSLPAVVEGREGWNEFRDDLLALLASETTAPVILAGHSMGGAASLLAAAEAPSRVKSLVLFDPVLLDNARAAADAGDNPLAQGADRRRATFPDKAAALAAYTGRGAFRSWSPDQLADYVEAGFRATPDGEVTLTCAPAWEASNFRTHNYDMWAAIRSIVRPVRMLRAGIGSTARIEGHEADLAGIGAEVETIEAASHFLPMERPDLVRAELRRAAGL